MQAYPGSPLIARALLRPQDRLVACEVADGARKQLIIRLSARSQARNRRSSAVAALIWSIWACASARMFETSREERY